MDGHPSGPPQGAGGQTPAYRSAHRHPPRWGQSKGGAFVSAFRVVGGCPPNCVGAGRRPVKRTPGALGVGIEEWRLTECACLELRFDPQSLCTVVSFHESEGETLVYVVLNEAVESQLAGPNGGHLLGR